MSNPTVSQSGTVTPNHLAVFATDGVIQDGGAWAASQRVLGRFISANFNTATDQAILINPAVLAFQLTGIIITNPSVSLTTAVGGFYTAQAKGGQQIVANSQTYSALTSSSSLLNATLTGFTTATRFSASNLSFVLGPNNLNVLALYFALTTPQGAQATADIYVVGIDLSP